MYGLDAELKAKADAKYDHELEKQVLEWIEAITGESMGMMTFAEWLNDGQVLCHLVNNIKPGTIKKPNKMKAPFKKMENITWFTDAARKFGVVEASMFATPDLYEEKNLGSVVNCIYTFASVIQTSVPEFDGPKLGIAVAGSKDIRSSRGPVTQTGGLTATDQMGATGSAKMGATGSKALEVAKPPSPRTSPKTSPNNSPRGGKPPARAGQKIDLTEGLTEAAAMEAKTSEAMGQQGSNSKADTQGLDADLKKKMAEKFNPEEDRQVCEWIEAVTGEAKGDQSTFEYLKNGQVLCHLANAIQPASVKGISKSNMPFNQMENIKKFLGAARALGMPESSCFSTPDLFEEKNMGIVIQMLFAFGGVVQAKVTTFKGPHLGIAMKAATKGGATGA